MPTKQHTETCYRTNNLRLYISTGNYDSSNKGECSFIRWTANMSYFFFQFILSNDIESMSPYVVTTLYILINFGLIRLSESVESFFVGNYFASKRYISDDDITNKNTSEAVTNTFRKYSGIMIGVGNVVGTERQKMSTLPSTTVYICML